MTVRGPSGAPPPETWLLPGGDAANLVALATEICARYRAEFPDEHERYGDAGMEWCRHDNQYLLAWALIDADIENGTLADNVAWLGRVLAARDFPLERLQRDLELAAEVCREQLPHIPRVAELLAAAVEAVPV